ncbi:MAG: hypothetical protein IPG32_18150, partial [Saprospirales bacterium]|nr:hypothetical protein [Saprospirales bacterium]
ARITAELKADPERVRAIRNPYEEILFVWKDEKAYAKRMFFFHQEDGGINRFSLAEESDGT